MPETDSGLPNTEYATRNTQYPRRNTEHPSPIQHPPSSIHHPASTVRPPQSHPLDPFLDRVRFDGHGGCLDSCLRPGVENAGLFFRDRGRHLPGRHGCRFLALSPPPPAQLAPPDGGDRCAPLRRSVPAGPGQRSALAESQLALCAASPKCDLPPCQHLSLLRTPGVPDPKSGGRVCRGIARRRRQGLRLERPRLRFGASARLLLPAARHQRALRFGPSWSALFPLLLPVPQSPAPQTPLGPPNRHRAVLALALVFSKRLRGQRLAHRKARRGPP